MTVFIEVVSLMTMIVGSVILICLLIDRVIGLIRLSNIVEKLFENIIVVIASALFFVLILFAIATVAGLFVALAVLLLGVIS